MTTSETPAETLRRAAKLMRERAKLVPSPPWFSGEHDVTTADGLNTIASSGLSERAEYVRSWHPGVTLAIADWLDQESAKAAAELKLDMPECPHDGQCHCSPTAEWGCEAAEWGCEGCGEWLGGGCICWDRSLAVARAYLGEAS